MITAKDVLRNPQDYYFDFSDRFLGLVAGTTYGGNDPKTVAEALRKNGLIPEDLLPFSDELKTLEEYYSFEGSDENECRGWGRKWLKQWDFGYEFLFNSDVPDKPKRMMEGLRYSPLGVSVLAWRKEGEFYVKDKNEKSNHWTTLIVGYKENKYWLIDDSYLDNGINLKKLPWDYPFDFAMRYHIELKKKDEVINSIWEQLKNICLSLVKLLTNEVEEAEKSKIIALPTMPKSISKYDWTTREFARHSARVIMDEYKLGWNEKNLLCAVIQAESGFHIKAINLNKDGSKDYSLCQFNDGPPKVPSNKKWWIGEGKDFKDVQDVYDNPERQVRVMIREYKKGNLKAWYAYSNGSYKKYLA